MLIVTYMAALGSAHSAPAAMSGIVNVLGVYFSSVAVHDLFVKFAA